MCARTYLIPFLQPKSVSRHHLITFFSFKFRPTALTYSGNCKDYQFFIVPHLTHTADRTFLLTDTPILFSCLSIIASHFAMRIVLLKEGASTLKRCRPPSITIVRKSQWKPLSWNTKGPRMIAWANRPM